MNGGDNRVGKNPKVSVIIPCRNEKDFIEMLLENIVSQDYPKEHTEVFVVDGMSEDGTREVIRRFAGAHGYIRLVDNPELVVPHALNRGIRLARGEYIVRMDTHSTYPPDYISRLLFWHRELGADNVGGVGITRPFRDTPVARAAALALSHPFGVGNSYFRIGTDKPREVDTVPFGCYKREIFDRIGLFDEDLIRNQDDEFNLRLKRHGGRIFLVPEIKIIYYSRDRLMHLFRMYHQYGFFKPLVAVKAGAPSSVRQFAPPFFVLSPLALAALGLVWPPFFYAACGVLGLYCIANACFSFRLALRHGIRLFFPLFYCFGTVHLGYGTGYLRGLLTFTLFQKKRKTDPKKLGLSR
ncbi:MAG: glycosyltransferase family 2 protein [Spirochaetes bacterium]|nr:glycosyltransferase family 2 protein [Spirochaetota bacterium]